MRNSRAGWMFWINCVADSRTVLCKSPDAISTKHQKQPTQWYKEYSEAVFLIPLYKLSQTFLNRNGRMKSEVFFKGGTVRVCDRHISRLHAHKFLMSFKIIILWKEPCPDQFSLKRTDEIKQIGRRAPADVVYRMRCLGQSILSLLRCISDRPDHAFEDVINRSSGFIPRPFMHVLLYTYHA